MWVDVCSAAMAAERTLCACFHNRNGFSLKEEKVIFKKENKGNQPKQDLQVE
jgi:hypothetical protein